MLICIRHQKEAANRRRVGQFSIVLQSFERPDFEFERVKSERCVEWVVGVGRVINGGRYLDKFIAFLFNNLSLQELLSIFLVILLGCVLHKWQVAYVSHNLNDEYSGLFREGLFRGKINKKEERRTISIVCFVLSFILILKNK